VEAKSGFLGRKLFLLAESESNRLKAGKKEKLEGIPSVQKTLART